jgi:hypothetical protein
MNTTPVTPRKIHEIFESMPCTRCYGHANAFSCFNVYAGKCFKCSGALFILTKHGQKNYNTWRAACDAITLKTVADVKVGDYIKMIGCSMKYVKVVKLEQGGKYTSRSNGGETSGHYIDIELEIGVYSGLAQFGKCKDFSLCADSQIHIHPGVGITLPKADDFVTEKKHRQTALVA